MKTVKWLIVFILSTFTANAQSTSYRVVAYYPFTGNANDASGFNNNAAIHGATLTNDRFGNPNSAYYFDGAGDYIIVEQSNRLNNFPVTISAWVKPELRQNIDVRYGNRGTTIQYPNNVISNDNPYNYGHGFGLNVWEIGAQLTIQFNDGNEIIPLDTRGDKWYFVAVAYNYGSFSLYVNGKYVQSKQYGQGQVDGLNHILIGKHNDDLNGWGNKIYFKGIIDEVTIYGAGLDDSQIEEVYKKSSIPPVPPKPALVESVVSGQIFDKQTLRPVKATLSIVSDRPSWQPILTDNNGVYSFRTLINNTYTFLIDEAGYELLRESISIDKPNLTKNFFLLPKPTVSQPLKDPAAEPKRNESIVLKNVLFELSTATLLPESSPELNHLAGVMQGKPTMKIRLEGHTDRIGDAVKNLKLSQERVLAVKHYLTQKGISESRITTKGYGDSKTICNPPCEANRRVEFVVTEQ